MINEKIKINEKDYEILKDVLEPFSSYKFYIYGSRVKGKAKKYSDLDIYCKQKILDGDLSVLKFDLEESDLTIKVDVLDPSMCSEEFKEKIEKDLVEIK